MWRRIVGREGREASAPRAATAAASVSRRAYYRVSATLPIRLEALASDEVDAAIYELTLPLPEIEAEAPGGDEESLLLARLRRIEEKLDRLLAAGDAAPRRPLSGADRRLVVFSGAGLALDVDHDFRAGDAYRVELLLPAPNAWLVRAVGEAVTDGSAATIASVPSVASGGSGSVAGPRRLALAFRHIEPADRDALVAFSYEIQRLELRARLGAAAAGA